MKSAGDGVFSQRVVNYPVAKLADAVKALLGVSTYQPKSQAYGPSLSDGQVEEIRRMIGGGQLTPPPQTQTRWYLSDLETARVKADTGDLTQAGKLWASMKVDGTLAGLLRTLTSGLVRLPKRFYGDPDLVKELQPNNGTVSAFDAMNPPVELAALAGDGHGLGVGVAEYLPVEGRTIPVLSRLEPEFLQYRWDINRWFYRSTAGLLPITPGDGRWVLHLPGGRVNPWRAGLWPALGKAFIQKDHANFYRGNYISKLANSARVATSPAGASDEQRQGLLARVIAWGVNTVFELPAGYDVKLIESNGRGVEIFQEEIDQCDKEITIAIAGQVVTTDGGAGFSNSEVHRLIRSDIIQDVGDALAHTLNTQCLPLYSVLRRGIGGLDTRATVEYITDAPKDHEATARTMVSVGAAITSIRTALAPDGKKPETKELMTRFDIPTEEMTPEEIAKASEPDQTGEKSSDGAKISGDGQDPPGDVG